MGRSRVTDAPNGCSLAVAWLCNGRSRHRRETKRQSRARHVESTRNDERNREPQPAGVKSGGAWQRRGFLRGTLALWHAKHSGRAPGASEAMGPPRRFGAPIRFRTLVAPWRCADRLQAAMLCCIAVPCVLRRSVQGGLIVYIAHRPSSCELGPLELLDYYTRSRRRRGLTTSARPSFLLYY